MSRKAEMNCPFCGKRLDATILDNEFYMAANCETCGNYIFKLYNHEENYKGLQDKIASYLFYHKDEEKRPCFFIGERTFYESKYKDEPNIKFISIDEIENWYPKTFSDKVDKFLLYLDSRSNYLGDIVLFSEQTLYSACFVKRNPSGAFVKITNAPLEQTKFFTKYLNSQNYCKSEDYQIEVLAEGYKRIDKLQKNDKNNKNIFVSMAFNDSTKATREAIRQGVINSGLSAEFIDEIIHNHQIMPEMFRLIRESKMLILEISDPNFGAYYEAGYALGLGKEVIICCNQDVFNGKININNKEVTEEEIKKFGKYLLPHFDIAQKQILVWKDHADLTKKIAEWIKALS